MNENLNRKDLELAIQKTRDSFDTDKPVIPFIEGDGIGIDIGLLHREFSMLLLKKLIQTKERLNGKKY